jgi:hypothetical protein
LVHQPGGRKTQLVFNVEMSNLKQSTKMKKVMSVIAMGWRR